MSTENTLDSSEDLESLDNVPLVRMVDVQPIDRLQDSEEIETCIIDDGEYECIVDEEDSNLGSIVSVQSEEIVYDDGTIEFVVPEFVEMEGVEDHDPVSPGGVEDPNSEQLSQDEQANDHSPIMPIEQESWPSLEILPGGVINLTDKNGGYVTADNCFMDPSDMLYACAKCSQRFKFLFCLVKHVKWHQDEEKKKRIALMGLSQTNQICLKSKVKGRKKLKSKARKVPKKS